DNADLKGCAIKVDKKDPRYPCHPRLKNNIPNGANHFCSFPFRYEQKSPRMSYTYTSGGSVLSRNLHA
ncbi:hypothetical protein, partial [Bacteroides cellulosilyticus]|uniref:hypothetical protein n=1 Tax=Bacteroides cellulosilyticus TaxID=246787 RepID=UPI0032ECC20D